MGLIRIPDLRGEEVQCEALTTVQTNLEAFALLSRRVKDNNGFVCGNKGHTHEKCWQVIEYPSWRPRSKRFPQKRTGRGPNQRNPKFRDPEQRFSKLSFQPLQLNQIDILVQEAVALLPSNTLSHCRICLNLILPHKRMSGFLTVLSKHNNCVELFQFNSSSYPLSPLLATNANSLRQTEIIPSQTLRKTSSTIKPPN
ncbi:LOW QUALITY PROTEIN: hypothetical protein Cgig2_022977 [Carnegiea gigantea]|uniref:Uncharacterized protein n=1 Tax=Carnegiea gigantea TaxID=171969 RepID=A0A9Q1JU95_9CARY|nr:LOW QUALITY PROTEIN: hypothetical protein Cgig2_022977 [Carnegiea gigantea]